MEDALRSAAVLRPDGQRFGEAIEDPILVDAGIEVFIPLGFVVGERVRYNNGLFAWIGFPAVGVPFGMQPRKTGESSRWLPLHLARLAFDGLASFSTFPLRVSSVFGLLVSAVAFVYILWIMAKTLIFGDPVRGYPTLMVAVLFFAGVQLIFLGVLGEYLGRVYEEVKARPLFLVREEVGVAQASSAPGMSREATTQ